ncbi:hypothetical protein P8452_00206 [Trifolium repens]|nr:hypothetical protein P8452_00206 [Trifolium repens]
MGWLSRIFKGSDHKDVWAENDNEYIDRAIALSLAKDNHKAKKVKDHKSQLEEDEQLAGAIEESLNLESPPKHGNDNNNNMYQPNQYFPMRYRICAGCNTEIGYGRYLNCLGAFWHPECFRCRACNLPISDYEFSISGNYPYHKACYKESYHPKCDVCKHLIPTNPAGLIEYRAPPFWNQHYCPSHEHDNTPRCCSCERMEPQGTGYIALKDGRKLCLECLDSSFMDTNECQPLHADILKFYESINMRLDQQVPLLLVERQALNEAREGEKNMFLNIVYAELHVDKESVGGCGGIIGRKKGAVAIRINYNGISLVFISCHLSAHGRNVEERNYECRHISHSLFSKTWNPYSRSAHMIVWLGDLNYRLQGIDTHPARNLINKDLHHKLHGNDQLLQQAGEGQIFNGFCEGTLTFKPTYKYNKGSSNYDTSHKVRVPAWTDRILFKIEDTDNVEATLHSYESLDEIYGSDHKPVKAHICLRLGQTQSSN